MLLEMFFGVTILVLMSDGTGIPTQGSADVCNAYTGKIDQLTVKLMAALNDTVMKLDSNQQCTSMLNDFEVKYEAKWQQLFNKLELCKIIPPTYPKSCFDWKQAGYLNDGDYVIDPDGPGGVPQFHVDCNMNAATGSAVVTVIHHDTEAKTSVPKCSAKHCYTKDVKYTASMDQIIALIQQSRSCEQFIKYDCHHSVLLSPNEHGTYASWYSRNGKQMDYWGGAKPGSKMCACGMNSSCDKSGYACNCDINDEVWRSDSGYISDMNALPVTKMTYGDTDMSFEQGFYSLGPLRCYWE